MTEPKRLAALLKLLSKVPFVLSRVMPECAVSLTVVKSPR